MSQSLRPVPWRACIFVFVVGLLVRFGWVVATDQIHLFPRKEMVRIAMTFAERGELADPFAAPTGPTALAPPIYPIFLGLIFRTFGTGVAAEVVKCSLTSAISALRWAMIPWLAVCLGLSLRTGVIGGLLGAFYIGALATDVKGDWAEAYVATAMVGLFLAAIALYENPQFTSKRAAILGFWCGLALLLSPALATIIGTFILVGALRFLKESPRRYVQFAAVLGLVAALVISPWPIRNAIQLGSPIWAKSNFGIVMLASNHPGAGWDVFANEVFIETLPSWQPSAALQLKAVGEVAYNQAMLQQSMQWIRANQGTFAHLVALRAFHFWFPTGQNALHTVLEYGLTLMSLIGLYLLYVKHRAAALLILGIWLLYPPLYYIVLWSSRYRYPINWTLMLTAAVALNHIVSLASAPRTSDQGVAQ
jgi:hypothetical protein